jgi:hypothetical protein
MSIASKDDPILVVFQPGGYHTHLGGGTTGAGTVTWSTGHTYTGALVDFSAHGQGTQTSASGDTYTGLWDHGKAEGIGTYVDAQGNTYRGMWHDGRRHGIGVTIARDGERNVCGWHDGQRHGYGTARWNEKDQEGFENRYSGGFRRGKSHGFGEKKLVNKTRYVGGFKDHEFWGCGTWWTAEGKKYEGGYRDQKCHGYVTITEAGETEGKEQFYKDDQVSNSPATVVQILPSFELVIGLVGAVYRGGLTHTTQGFISWPGGYYDGALDGGYPHGYGVAVCLSTTTGEVQQWYEGGWDYGRASGYGEYCFISGEKYEGGWKNGKPHGFAYVTKSFLGTASRSETFWKEGAQVG